MVKKGKKKCANDFNIQINVQNKKRVFKAKKSAKKCGIYHGIQTIFGVPKIFEGAYAYADNEGYHYVILERGKISEHKVTDDLFEISYWILESEVFSMAVKFELNNRINNQDSRRLIFMKQLELLNEIGEEYRKRDEMNIEEILKKNPYHDE